MLSRLPGFIQSTAFREAARRDSRNFTRTRGLPFTDLIAFLLCDVRGAVQGELDAFFTLLARRTRLPRGVTASAFSKARSRLFANVFDPLNTGLLRLALLHKSGTQVAWFGVCD